MVFSLHQCRIEREREREREREIERERERERRTLEGCLLFVFCVSTFERGDVSASR